MGDSNVQHVEKSKAEHCNGEMNGNLSNKTAMNGTCSAKRFTKETEKLQFTRWNIRLKIFSLLSLAWFSVECLLGYAVLLSLAVCLAPLLVVYNLLKLVEIIAVKATSGDIPLNGQDALWQQRTKENPLVINGLIRLENQSSFEKTFEDFRQGILDRMVNAKKPNGELVYPRARYSIRPGYFQYFFQADKSFSIENHVFKLDVDVPSSKDELEALVSKMTSEALSQDHPPWYFACLPTNYGPKDMAIVFKMSHSVADGVSIARFLTSQLADEDTPAKQPGKSSSNGRAFLMAKALFITPRYLVSRLLVFADKSILHGQKISGVKKIVWHEGFNLDTVKEIKTATNTTVNDVLMSCLSLAIRGYFQRKGVDHPDDFTASIPIDVRSSASKKGLPTFENKFAVVFLKLPVGTDGVLEQLYETKARMDKVKVSGEPLGMAAAMYLTVELVPEFLSRPINTIITQKSSCVCSNVPGPQKLLTVKDTTVKSMTFWPPQRDNIGVGLSIYTYGGKVIVGVQSDVTTLPDPEIITEEFGNAVKQMAKNVLHTDYSNGHAY